MIDGNIGEAERFGFGHAAVSDGLHVSDHFPSHLLVRLFSADNGA